MADLDFMEYRTVILKSDQEPSTVARMVGMARLCLKHLPCKSNGEAERAVQSVHGLTRTLQDFIEQQSGITLESRSPLLAWLHEHCPKLLLLCHTGEPHDGHTAYMRLQGKPWRVELPNFGECVDYRKRTRHKLETTWSRGVFVGV